jgi:hypothetical protein
MSVLGGFAAVTLPSTCKTAQAGPSAVDAASQHAAAAGAAQKATEPVTERQPSMPEDSQIKRADLIAVHARFTQTNRIP